MSTDPIQTTVPSTSATAPESAVADPRAAEDGGLRFDDPYWDDAFCAWWDPALRTCCD